MKQAEETAEETAEMVSRYIIIIIQHVSRTSPVRNNSAQMSVGDRDSQQIRMR